MTQAFVDIHILQSVPPSCLNRDESGLPKTAVYGGVVRSRVSSQAWKRATRSYFNERRPDENFGIRTRKLPALLVDRTIERLGEQAIGHEERIVSLANTASAAIAGVKVPEASRSEASEASDAEAGKSAPMSDKEKKADRAKRIAESKKPLDMDAAVFVASCAIDALVEHIVAALDSDSLDTAAMVEEIRSRRSLDIALFGRMVAKSTQLNVDAACQVAHAISTHRVAGESDFYTTVDDLSAEDENGSAMMGDIHFASSTLYRYASVDLANLSMNLRDPAAVPAGVRAFVEAFTYSLPSGRQNSFAALTIPDLVFVALRTDQPVSFAGAFEVPVATHGGYVAESAQRLTEYATHVESLYLSPRQAGWATYMPACGDLTRLGRSLPFGELLNAVETAARGQVARSTTPP